MSIQALLISRNAPEEHKSDLVNSTTGIVFMGTPYAGASKADIAGYVTRVTHLLRRTNKAIVGVLEPNSEVLASAQQEFHTMLRYRNDVLRKRIKIFCFIEELATRYFGKDIGLVSFPQS
jgi:hypothetical protein